MYHCVVQNLFGVVQMAGAVNTTHQGT